MGSLCAEGTPVLALELCRIWLNEGIQPSVVTLAETPDDLRPEFQTLGVPMQSLQIRERGTRRYAEMAHGMYRVCREFRPDAFLSMPLGWHSFLATGARCAGVRRTAAHVGNYPSRADATAFEKFRFLIQIGRPVTSRLICCSEYVRQGVVKHFRVPPGELEMIYNGCPVENVAKRAQRARDGRTDHRPTVGMVARLEIHKDQPTLIRAAALLAARGIAVNVQLVGEGSRRTEYERLIRSLGLEQQVRLLGMRRDIPELLGTLDAFVFAATPDEGLGVALLEAMAAGVPIVATDVGACREVLDYGRLGKLVPPRDPEALAAAIETVLQSREQTQKQTARGKAKVQSFFTIDAMAHAYARCLGLTPA